MSTEKLEVLTPENSQLIFIDHQPQMAFGVQSIDRQTLKNNVAIGDALGFELYETADCSGTPVFSADGSVARGIVERLEPEVLLHGHVLPGQVLEQLRQRGRVLAHLAGREEVGQPIPRGQARVAQALIQLDRAGVVTAALGLAGELTQQHVVVRRDGQHVVEHLALERAVVQG